MKILILLSGGIDSTTLLYKYRRGAFCEAVTFDYNQTHRKEIEVAKSICANFPQRPVKHHICELPQIFTCPLTGSVKPIPSGDSVDNIIPNRNGVMLMTATALAIEWGFDAVSYGSNADDAANFPDCSKPFIQSMREVMRLCHTRPIELLTPFIDEDMTKKGVVALADTLSVPISETWSCYKGQSKPCGECAACQLRNAAIEANRI
jgi:7-cyano-7-deazaguanine synthase